MNRISGGKTPTKTIIMGIGNLLLSDEGVGVHAAHALLETDLPEGIQVLDVGTAFLDALPELENSERIIVIDAMKANGKPGSLYRVPLDECSCPERIDSMHGFDVFRMLAIAQNSMPAEVTVFGVEPACIDWGMDLSPQVFEVMPFLLDAVYEEIVIDKTCNVDMSTYASI